jgi:hypothetical protein
MLTMNHLITYGCSLVIMAAAIYIAATVRRMRKLIAQVPKITQYHLPIYWATYLINQDDSGIEPQEKAEADRWLAEHQLPYPVDVEETGIGRWNGLICDMGLYSFLT